MKNLKVSDFVIFLGLKMHLKSSKTSTKIVGAQNSSTLQYNFFLFLTSLNLQYIHQNNL